MSMLRCSVATLALVWASSATAQAGPTSGQGTPGGAVSASGQGTPGGAVSASATQGTAGSGAESDGGIGDIIVTAQRRNERLQDVPLSVTAATGEQLRELNVTDTGRIELLTPGLTWGNDSGARAWPSLRGVETANGEANGEPAIAFFVDDVYKSRNSQANVPLVDVARVEVLRGPQGTLFGRNSTGGAINILTNAPDPGRLAYGLEGTIGRFENRRVEGFLNAPIGDDTAARFAFTRHRRDGYLRNLGTGGDANDQNLWYGRAALRHQSGPLDVTARFSVMDVDRNGAGAFTSKVLGQTYTIGTPSGRSIYGQPIFINPRVLDGKPDVVTPTGPRDIGTPVERNPFQFRTNFPGREQTRSYDGSLIINYDLGPATLTSVTGLTDFSSVPIQDNDFTDLNSIANATSLLSAASKSFQQELRLGSAAGSPLTWVIGGFYFKDKIRERFAVEDLNRNNYAKPGGGTTSLQFDRRTSTNTDSYALFGQASYAIFENFSLTAGGRYTIDEKSYTLRELGFFGTLGTNPPLDIDRTFKKFTWRLGAEYRPTPDNLLYASASTGFRSGGFNRFNDDPTTAEDERVFNSETMTAYEVGSKNDFGRRIRLNVAAFLQVIKDQQVATVQTILNTGQSGFFNAGRTRIYGAEADLTLRPVTGWLINANATLLNARYRVLATPGFQIDVGNQSLRGNKVPRSPDFKLNVSSSYRIDLGGSGALVPSAAVQYNTAYHHTQFNTAIDRQRAYARADVRLAYEVEDGRFRIEGFVENVTNEVIMSYGIFGGNNAYFVNYAMPRTWGVRLSFRN
jgi:iron complex outermembrane receptor protein